MKFTKGGTPPTQFAKDKMMCSSDLFLIILILKGITQDSYYVT